jgi:hypothetical protein
MLVETENNEYRTIMTGYTKEGGIVQVITDNPFTSVVVEYDTNGELLHYEVNKDKEVKEF